MAKKQVAVLVRRTPLNSVKAAEALRHSAGLTLSDYSVTVLLADAAVWLAVPMAPEVIDGGDVKKAIDAVVMMGGQVKAEAESLARFGIGQEGLMAGIQVVSKDKIISDLTSAEAAIVF